MGTRHDYARQAETYDRTRSASPSVLRPVLAALAGAPGRRLLDVGGGTGNYAIRLREAGFHPTVVDVSEPMLARAAAKGLDAVRADAAALPFAGGSADAIAMISMLHLVPDWRRALAEARRVLRPGARLVIQAFARENLGVHWIFEYFPGSKPWIYAEHQTVPEILAELPGAAATPFLYEDLADGTMAALCRRPELLLDPARRAQTSFLERLAKIDPEAHREGLARLERDLARGRRPHEEVADLRDRVGDGTVIGWASP